MGYDNRRKTFPSPCGDELFRQVYTLSEDIQCFRPLAGMNCFPVSAPTITQSGMFPSPCGDELFLARVSIPGNSVRFRPLAGMNCFGFAKRICFMPMGFRPLAGMNCFGLWLEGQLADQLFPSPCGDELFH